MSVFNITQITFMQFRFSFFLSKDNRHREEDRCTDRKSLQRYVCLWKEPFYLKGLCLATTFPVPPSSNADSSLWSTDQLPPPSSPTTLLQDLPGPAVCCRGPPPAHPGPRRGSQHPLSWRFQRSLAAPPPGDPRDAAGAGKLNPNSTGCIQVQREERARRWTRFPPKSGDGDLRAAPHGASREHPSSAGVSSHTLGGPVSSATQICLPPRNPEPEDAKSAQRRRDARGKGLASLRLWGSPGPYSPRPPAPAAALRAAPSLHLPH